LVILIQHLIEITSPSISNYHLGLIIVITLFSMYRDYFRDLIWKI